MISSRLLSFFGLIYGGIIVVSILSRLVNNAYGIFFSLGVTLTGAILTTAAVYYSDRRFTAHKKRDDDMDLQTRWRNDLYGDL